MKVKIYAEYNYFQGTYNAPEDGYIKTERYDSRKGYDVPVDKVFESVEAAYDYLTEQAGPCNYDEAMSCTMGQNYWFSTDGEWVCNHGQHSRPYYQIRDARTGRCTQAIKAELDKLNKVKA